jgi:hypothetical protein
VLPLGHSLPTTNLREFLGRENLAALPRNLALNLVEGSAARKRGAEPTGDTAQRAAAVTRPALTRPICR